jgi:hypothetical protein
MSKWAFAELRVYIEYKAALAGVKVQPVDPRDTSKRCPKCNHVSKKNRIRRDVFLCDECGYFVRHEVVPITVKGGAYRNFTRCSASGFLPAHALPVMAGCEAAETM